MNVNATLIKNVVQIYCLPSMSKSLQRWLKNIWLFNLLHICKIPWMGVYITCLLPFMLKLRIWYLLLTLLSAELLGFTGFQRIEIPLKCDPETSTGKEVVQKIHKRRREQNSLVAIVDKQTYGQSILVHSDYSHFTIWNTMYNRQPNPFRFGQLFWKEIWLNLTV